MITLGTVVEILECLKAVEAKGVKGFSNVRPGLYRIIGPFSEFVLKNHFRMDPPAFWEQGDGTGSPAVNAQGKKVVDPGHATECSGFMAEAMRLVPGDWRHGPLNRKKVIDSALAMHLFADRIGFSKIGVMYKYVDLDTGAPLPDTQALNAGGRLTAPWWNVREHCAAALRLYTLTEDPRLIASFQKAQNASYRYYTNKRIDGQMVQTLDPEKGKALDIAPSTGNLDAMHDPRARLRETVCLEELLAATK
jgi:mannose/cellobiose epimerase-like protein (N-acyl-D-glucosamine 2-epimerase family)